MRNNVVTLGLVVLLAGSAFFIGTLYQKVQTLEGQAKEVTQEGQAAGAQVEDNAGAPEPQTAEDVPPVTEEDHVRGDRNARIMLIEYSDYECPFCQRFHATAQQVVDEYEGQVAWVYRHFPLVQLHPNAPMEAEAAECVADQGGEEGFWQFTDLIFERTDSTGTSFTEEKVADLAAEIGLDKGKFSECLESGKFKDKVDEHMAGGQAAGVTGTPGNILLDTETGETRLIPGAVPFEQIKQTIDNMLQV